MYNNACSFLLEQFPQDFAWWFLGERLALNALSPKALALSTTASNPSTLFQAEAVLLQVEFQVQPQPEISFRMLNYRIRAHQAFPNQPMQQVVVYLKPTNSLLARQTRFTLEKTQHEFTVIRLWEQPTQPFLESLGLLPFATLTQVSDRPRTLKMVSDRLKTLPNQRNRHHLQVCTAILASLVLEPGLIEGLLGSDILEGAGLNYALQLPSNFQEFKQVLPLN